MGKTLAEKRGLKRPMSVNKAEDEKKKQRKKADDKAIQTSSPISTVPSGILSSEEDDVPSKPLAFDSLLKQLGSESDRLDGSYTKRQREGKARSDSEEDKNDDFGSANSSDENKELHSESSLDAAEGDSPKQRKHSNIMKQSEKDETEDEASGSGSDSPTNVDETSNIRKLAVSWYMGSSQNCTSTGLTSTRLPVLQI